MILASSSKAQESKVVAVASIAAELHSVMNVAWGVSLAAKNAKVISTRAGEKARGFQPITNFIDEISQQAIQGVNEIDHEALKLSHITVAEQRASDAYQRFSSVINNSADARYIDTLAIGMARVKEDLDAAQNKFRACLNNLISLLEAMEECMLSARAIASVSRIVTSNIQEYRDNLQVVANNLDDAAVYIKEKVTDSYKHLNRVNLLSRKNL